MVEPSSWGHGGCHVCDVGVTISKWCLVKALAPAEGQRARLPQSLPGPLMPAISSWQLNAPPSQEEVKNGTPQSGALKFNGGPCIFNKS